MIFKDRTIIAWGIMLLSAGMMFFASFVGGFQRNPGLYLPIALIYIALGGLLAIRNPKNAIGWIFLVAIFLLSINVAMVWYANLGLVIKPGSLPGADIVAAVMGVFENLGYGLLLIFPFLLFPNGQLISRRWMPVLWLACFAMLLECFEIFRPGQLLYFPDWNNPLGIDQLRGYFEISGIINSILAIILFSVGPISIILRYRWASIIERQQIKWFTFAGICVSVWIIFVVFFFESLPEILGIVLESIVLASLPLAIAISIFRYRLWDIDIIIRRTVQYALLTGVLALVYFGSVVLLQRLIGQFTGEQSPAVIVISTLAIVVLFNPLRTRIQDFIDRRFYRQKYDAERALEEFAATARDEVELEKLTIALLSVVEETVQPEKISLWLRHERR